VPNFEAPHNSRPSLQTHSLDEAPDGDVFSVENSFNFKMLLKNDQMAQKNGGTRVGGKR